MKYIKIIIFLCVTLILFCLITYFSMNEYSSEISASCLDCPFLKDVMFFSLFSSVILTIALLIIKRLLKNRLLVLIFTIVIFVILAFINNYNIFVDRVSAWSSFSLEGEIMGVISLSYLYIIISTFLLWSFIKFLKLMN